MRSRLRELPEDTLRRLAAALGSRRIGPPWPDDALAHVVGGPDWLGAELRELTRAGVDARSLGWALDTVADERAEARRRWEGVELTWTGPDDVVTETRDTGAVARQLFATATQELLVATYALDDDRQAAELLGVLRDRVREVPSLRVRFFVNIERKWDDDRPDAAVVAGYREWFCRRVWPWDRRPEVFYDRRAVVKTSGVRACLHAKCLVQDAARTLVTSANLTEAAQMRNIEAGVLVADQAFARQVTHQFERLVEHGVLVPI